ncbi:WD40 repeat domain-containing protein [Streptomyces sp. CBMA29]|uniref:WD40 repeat domain-containing protein n=1 Tax=Streptomyces sp. CBMA29 TaxID=1896314 RepID=UPI0016619B18|nr:PQQ-binding-like beta-propeller repeat protein [Streptomyces sp. CBMA29]MBD0740319.1 hypothetical protein [Streptomyces sp. CBMA29]
MLRLVPVSTIATDPARLAVPKLADDGAGEAMLLTSADDYDVRRWDIHTGELMWHFPGEDLVSEITVAYPPGGDPLVAVATDMGVVRVNAVTGSVVPDEDLAEIDTIWDITSGTLPDGRAFIAGAGHVDGLVHYWDAATGEPLGPPLAGRDRPVKTITSLTLQDGTAVIASEDEAGVILRWNAATGQRLGAPVHGPGTYNMQMIALTLPDGRALLASMDMNGTLSRWDAVTGEAIGTPLPMGPDATTLAGACWEGGGRLLISTVGGGIQVRDALTGDETDAELPGVNASVLTCPDGSTLLATGSVPRGAVHVYRLDTPPRSS